MTFNIKVDRVILSRLARQFGGIQPFSVLDTKSGLWQERKAEWVRLGIQSELGRGENLTRSAELADADNSRHQQGTKTSVGCLKRSRQTADTDYYRKKRNVEAIAKINGLTFKSTGFCAEIFAARGGGTSIFDPVLCEILYLWFCPKGGFILDPFAGGSVRGIVAAVGGYQYMGIDLRAEQVEANEMQWTAINEYHGPFTNSPQWRVGDAKRISRRMTDGPVDFIFTCPPYGDLEQYSDKPGDLSNMAPDEFDTTYAQCIEAAVGCLSQDRFAAIIVGDYRDKQGFYRNFVSKTIAAFEAVGCMLYNEAILLNAIGSLPVRAGKQFKVGRKLGKCHQNILVFFKGNSASAVKETVKLIEESQNGAE